MMTKDDWDGLKSLMPYVQAMLPGVGWWSLTVALLVADCILRAKGMAVPYMDTLLGTSLGISIKTGYAKVS